ncbi:MAG: POTRA domain-containing protein, partial [Bacteroidota bacterium]
MAYPSQNKRTILFLIAWIATVLVCPSFLFAQQDNQNQSGGNDIVRRVRFSGNQKVKDRTLETLVRTRTNREFLGIPRFTPWYFFWNVSKGAFGEEPAYLDRELVISDMERIRLYYESLGFREASVDTTIVEFRTNKIEVSFLINEGNPSRIEQISYSGIPFFEDVTKRTRFLENSPITKGRINDTTFVVRQQFTTQALADEQLRILNFLRNNGYASVPRDSVTAYVKAREDDPYKLEVLFRVFPGPVYRFGDVHISLADQSTPLEYDERRERTSDRYINPGSDHVIDLRKESSTQTKFSLLTDQILFKPGDIYNQSLFNQTISEFQNLGMLYIQSFAQADSTVQIDFSKPDIPSYFDLRTLTKHSIRTEFFGMRRYGFGTGVGLDYTNNNVFGKAENLTIGANTGFEFVTSETLNEILADDAPSQSQLFQNFELSAEYSVPRLAFPFAFLDNTKYFTQGVTRYTVAYSQSDQLFFDINSNIQFNFRYEVT